MPDFFHFESSGPALQPGPSLKQSTGLFFNAQS
ncbi:hypothetical protein SAMN05192553_105294, partial [Cyclobacterium xiamenense]